MTCTRCSREIDADSEFCRFCGAPVRPASAPRRLTRRPEHGKIAGVCAGLAEYFGVDVTLVRLAWIVLSIVPGAIVGGLIAYAIAWIVLPEGPPAAITPIATGRRLFRSSTDRRIAGVCGGLGEYLGIDSTMVRLAWVILSIYPGAIICGVLAYFIAWIVIPKAPEPTLEPSPSTP